MEAKSTAENVVELTDGGKSLGEICYDDAYFIHAKIKLADDGDYEISPVGFFGTKIRVTKEGSKIADLSMNWFGQIVIDFEGGKQYLFAAKSTFSNVFLLKDQSGEVLIQFNSKFNWGKFLCQYQISAMQTEHALLVLLGVFSANYLLATMAGVTSGMA